MNWKSINLHTMNAEVKLILGGVYKTILSEDPVRVLGFDDILVFYDVYRSYSDKWAIASNLKSGNGYFQQSPNIFLRDAMFIREQPLTNEEIDTFRPDLPIRLCRNKQMSWTDKIFSELSEFKTYASQFGCDISDTIVLPTPSITLEPLGIKGRITSLKSTLVKSIDKKGFSFTELLWLANNIQAEHSKHIIDKGVGIYRSGHKKKVPSYYIWGYYDMADNIPKEE
jgi:hypothetical protein